MYVKDYLGKQDRVAIALDFTAREGVYSL